VECQLIKRKLNYDDDFFFLCLLAIWHIKIKHFKKGNTEMVNIKTNRNSTNQTSIQNTEMTNNNIKKKIKKKEKKRQVEIEVLVCDRHKHVAGLNQLNNKFLSLLLTKSV
jgi:hypothetical protein